jgi:hypothetical protein
MLHFGKGQDPENKDASSVLVLCAEQFQALKERNVLLVHGGYFPLKIIPLISPLLHLNY